MKKIKTMLSSINQYTDRIMKTVRHIKYSLFVKKNTQINDPKRMKT